MMFDLFTKKETGNYGEKAACDFLKKQGYKIVVCNKRESHKEIDIIATDKNYIAFVEVKTRSVCDDLYSRYGTPASAVNASKQANLIAGARSYLRNNPTNKQPRMDVIEVYLKKGTREILQINHFKNAYNA